MKNRKKLLLASTLLVASAVGGVMALSSPQSGGADTSPIVQQVNHNTDELANHEARISNNENDVKDLQNKTNTPPSVQNTTPPSINAPAASSPVTDPNPAPITAPQPIVVISANYGFTFRGSGLGTDYTCELTYSDGTKIKVPTSVDDNCQEYIGQPKN